MDPNVSGADCYNVFLMVAFLRKLANLALKYYQLNNEKIIQAGRGSAEGLAVSEVTAGGMKGAATPGIC